MYRRVMLIFSIDCSPTPLLPPPRSLAPSPSSPSPLHFLTHENKQEQSSGLFTLGVVSYCLGVALVCERLNLSHEVRFAQPVFWKHTTLTLSKDEST